VQIVEWYDELVRLTDSPVARLNRAVAIGEAEGPRAGLAALAVLDSSLPRHAAVAAHLHERDGDLVTAARLYVEAARAAPNIPERDHLTRQAARLNTQLRRHTTCIETSPLGAQTDVPARGRCTLEQPQSGRGREGHP
jgi:predicted RNA polymerase sigma factor